MFNWNNQQLENLSLSERSAIFFNSHTQCKLKKLTLKKKNLPALDVVSQSYKLQTYKAHKWTVV